MNYAQDRLDRREFLHTILQEQVEVVHDGTATTATEEFGTTSASVSAPTAPATITNTRVELSSDQHTQYGQLCMIYGWNTYHALYHYCSAFYLHPISQMKLGNYIQLLEFCGIQSELSLLLLFAYRAILQKTNNNDKSSDSMNDECNERIKSLLIPPPSYTATSTTPTPTTVPNRYDLSMNEMIGYHCGCYDPYCGRIDCSGGIATTATATNTLTTQLYYWIPFPQSFINIVMTQLRLYCERSVLLGYKCQTQKQQQQPKEPDQQQEQQQLQYCTINAKSLNEYKWWKDPVRKQKMNSYIAYSEQERIPMLLQFWNTTTNTENGATSGTTTTTSNDIAFIPVIQLLCIKLLYMVIPSLAIEAIIHIRFHQERQNNNGNSKHTNDNNSFSTSTTMTKEYKSHYAFYVFIQSLVLGERIKPSRRNQMMYHHIPLWDRLWGLYQNINIDIECSGSDTKNGLVCDAYHHELVESFIINMQHIVDRLSERNVVVNRNHPIWIQPFISGGSLSGQVSAPIFLVGDSHVLSLAWQMIKINSSHHTKSYLIVPMLVTGLKAWHLRNETRFFTNTNFKILLQRLPTNTQTIIVSAGEIDCREGMGGPLLQGYTHECYEHVKATVYEYVSALAKIVTLTSNPISQILILPVAPHIERNKGRVVGQASRRETMQVWNDELRSQLIQYKGSLYLLDYIDKIQLPIVNSKTNQVLYALNPIFNADATHLNSAFVSHFRDAIVQSGCDLSKL